MMSLKVWLNRFVYAVLAILGVGMVVFIALEDERYPELEALDCPEEQVAVFDTYETTVYREYDPGDQSFDPRGSINPSGGGFETFTEKRAVCQEPTP